MCPCLSEFPYSLVITVNDVSKSFIVFVFFDFCWVFLLFVFCIFFLFSQLGSHLLYIMNATVHRKYGKSTFYFNYPVLGHYWNI